MQSWDVFYGGDPITILDEAECAVVADKVRGAQDIWIERDIVKGHPIKFHTLGAATYLDLDPSTYKSYTEKSVDRLHDLFDDLYVVLCDRMGKVLGNEVVIADDLAPPGFHIYQGNPLAGAGLVYGGNIHVDLPHEEHKDKYPVVDGVLSFTLPIEIPKAAVAGMYYWTDMPPLQRANMFGFVPKMQPEAHAWLDANKKAVTYKIGDVVMHEGRTPHQLANMCDTDTQDWRITLQGHGILSNGRWGIYF